MSNLFFILVLGIVRCLAKLFIANLTVNKLASLRNASHKHKIKLDSILALNVRWTIASPVVQYPGYVCRDSEATAQNQESGAMLTLFFSD